MDDSMRDFKWLFTEERLRNTPSYGRGISPEKELTFRQKQAMLIQAIGSKARLTQLAVKTSVVFMHRFFMYRSVLYYPRVQLAIAFALAGGKVEESDSARKLEYLIRCAVEVLCANKNREFLDKSDQFTYKMDCVLKPKIEALKESGCSTDSAEYLEMRKLILECETEIYSVIGFQLQITHPHNFVLRICGLLGEGIKDLTQYAYNLATASSQLTMLCLKYKPETIATMCLNVAFKANSVHLTSLNDPKTKWYHVYDADTDYNEIEAISEEFLKLLKSCPLLQTWMNMLDRIGRRSLSGPVRGPTCYPVSRPVTSSSAGKGISNNTHNSASQRFSSNRHPQPSATRQQGNRNPPSASASSSQFHLETQSSTSWAQQPPLSSSSSAAVKPSQDSGRPISRLGSSGDVSKSREDQSRPLSAPKPEPNPNSEQDRLRSQILSHRQQESSQQQQHLPGAKPAETGEDDETCPHTHVSNYYSPVAVRPPSPPFPPPDENEDVGVRRDHPQTSSLGTSNAGRISPPDINESNSSGFLASTPGAGSKLSLSDYRQRANAKMKQKANVTLAQAQTPNEEKLNTSKLQESFKSEEMNSECTPNSPEEEKPLHAITGFSFSKPQDSPSNPRITLKVKRDPVSGERHAVKYADSGLKIKIKAPKPESESENAAAAAMDQSAAYSTPREEGEILEDSPSPASSTGSSRKSEGIKIRLPVPKSSDGNMSKRDTDHWGSRRSAERDTSSHRSHHHGHHYHRSHHKSKKHKEHRSNRHEGKSASSTSHHSSKRSGSCTYDERQTKMFRLSDGSSSYSNSGLGGIEREIGGPPPPPLPPLPPPPTHFLQHQNSGFSINDVFSSSLLPGHDNLADYGDDENVSAPSTPLDGIPPHHERFHRMLQEHRAQEEAKRPPLPPVPPPPPPPASPPPPPPPSL